MVWTAHFQDNFNDGVLIGTSFMIGPAVGIATTICILAHEVPVEFGGFGVMVKAGIKPYTAIALNLASAMFALGGTVLVLALGAVIKELPMYLTPIGTGFALYLACRLVPMMEDEASMRKSLLTAAVFLLGFGAMVASKYLELWLGA
jgi:zinc transporter ZupT